MMSWYLLNVASDWWYLILKYYSRSAEDARVNCYELKDGLEVSASHVMEMGRLPHLQKIMLEHVQK